MCLPTEAGVPAAGTLTPEASVTAADALAPEASVPDSLWPTAHVRGSPPRLHARSSCPQLASPWGEGRTPEEKGAALGQLSC